MEQLKRLVIITGCSKGIGLALTMNLIASTKQHSVFGVSRSKPSVKGLNFEHFEADLSQSKDCEALMEKLKALISKQRFSEICLVNNAGRLGEINPSFKISRDDLAGTVFLNLTAPVMLQNYLVALSQEMDCHVEIINISSGAARKEYYGWGVYCASKAGLLMASKVLAKEIDQLSLHAKIWSFSPGVVDTSMQEAIRQSSKEQFIDVERFVRLKEEEKLLAPDVVAKFLVRAMDNLDFKNGEFYDIRDFDLPS